MTVIEKYRDIANTATIAQWVQAAQWYLSARNIATQLSMTFDISLDTAAGVIAAFSPRTRWAQNVVNATLFLESGTAPTLGNNVKMAENVLERGIVALRGRKTNSFARNIAGEESVVTIDVWMIKAAGYDRNDANKSMYDTMESAIVELASEFNVTPAVLQALIWINVRGNHD